MKVALIKPPATYSDWFRRPILGLAYIGASLQENGFDCKIFDAYFHGWSREELLLHVKDYQPDVVGISAMTHEIVQSAQIASELKCRFNGPVIIGGCHLTALPKETLAEFPAFDYGVHGEGERTILELLRCLEQNRGDLAAIQGLVFRKGQDIILNETRPFLNSAELDALPYPLFRDYYGENRSALAGKHSYYVMVTSRGCPHNCAFCMRVLGRKIRRRSAQNICAEIEFAISTYGAHTIDFADEILLFECPQTRELLELMIDRGLSKRINWTGLTRANFVNPELIALAKRSGCCRLGMGVESGDDGILRAIGKGITVEQVRSAVKIIKQAGILLETYYILGHPNETRQTLKKTIDLAAALNTDKIMVGLMVPYPGTRVFDMAIKGEGSYRLLTQDWSEYDKYFGKCLEIEGLPYAELERLQRWSLINLYLRNRRFRDALVYLWERRGALKFVLRKLLLSLKGVIPSRS